METKISKGSYKADPQKFESYIEWRRYNETGTYDDYRQAMQDTKRKEK